MHAWRNVSGSARTNCIVQAETAVLSVPTGGLMVSSEAAERDSGTERDGDENSTKELHWVARHACKIHECKICRASLLHVVGFVACCYVQMCKAYTCT